MKRQFVIRTVGCAAIALAVCSLAHAQGDKKPEASDLQIAVLNLETPDGFGIDSKALTDQVTTILAGIGNVRLIERADLSKVADEHKISLSGLGESATAVKLGKFVNAQYIVAGGGRKFDQEKHISLKIIDVETTRLVIVPAKATVEEGNQKLLERLEGSLKEGVSKLKKNPDATDTALAELRKIVKPIAGKVFLVDVSEEHVNRPLRDPAAQVAIANRLKALDLAVVVTKDPVVGWKQHLLETGKYGDKKVDYLIEGEGVSGLGGNVQGLTSCRARVELRIVGVPGRSVDVTDRGTGAGADLVEALAAKTALEEGAKLAIDATLKRLIAEATKEK
jgi:hypothetical protein